MKIEANDLHEIHTLLSLLLMRRHDKQLLYFIEIIKTNCFQNSSNKHKATSRTVLLSSCTLPFYVFLWSSTLPLSNRWPFKRAPRALWSDCWNSPSFQWPSLL